MKKGYLLSDLLLFRDQLLTQNLELKQYSRWTALECFGI